MKDMTAGDEVAVELLKNWVVVRRGGHDWVR